LEDLENALAVINYDSELRRAGAHSTHGWRKLTYLVQRHMLGAIGLVIMVLFVMAALLADFIGRYDPLSVDSLQRLETLRQSLETLNGYEFLLSGN